MKPKNLVLIPIIVAILAATAWSVYSSSKKTPPRQTFSTAAPQAPAENFFESLYEERLKEEGNRTAVTEKMIKDGKLSNEPARFVREDKEPSQ